MWWSKIIISFLILQLLFQSAILIIISIQPSICNILEHALSHIHSLFLTPSLSLPFRNSANLWSIWTITVMVWRISKAKTITIPFSVNVKLQRFFFLLISFCLKLRSPKSTKSWPEKNPVSDRLCVIQTLLNTNYCRW